MKRIENCELNEIVRPVMDGWVADGGGQMWQAQEYSIDKFHKDKNDRFYGPYSFVVLRDGVGLDYSLNYGRFVLGRLEPPPSLAELALLPQEFWTSSNGQYYDTGPNIGRFHALVREAEASGVRVTAAKPPRQKSEDKSYSINLANVGMTAHLSKQARVCLSLIIDAGKADGITEAELAKLLRENGSRLNTKQDPFKIFVFYKKVYAESGILETHEAGA